MTVTSFVVIFRNGRRSSAPNEQRKMGICIRHNHLGIGANSISPATEDLRRFLSHRRILARGESMNLQSSGYAQLYISYVQNSREASSMPLPLVERSKEEIARVIKRKVEGVHGVKSCHQLSVRITGKRIDVNLRALLDSSLKIDESHKVALDIEKEVKGILPSARVTIDTEPFGNGQENIWRLVKETAEETPGSRGAHNIHIQKISGKLDVDFHLEVSANMTVKQAHHVADQIEKKIKAAGSNISEVTVHIESASDRISKELAGIETELESYIEHVAEGFPEIKNVCDIRVRKFGASLHLVLQCRFDSKLSIKKAHEISSQLESMIKKTYPNVVRIDIHEEPA